LKSCLQKLYAIDLPVQPHPIAPTLPAPNQKTGRRPRPSLLAQ
jgi:hypothetical protein